MKQNVKKSIAGCEINYRIFVENLKTSATLKPFSMLQEMIKKFIAAILKILPSLAKFIVQYYENYIKL